MRGDRRVSRATRVEVVTTGVLVRRLQRDPELAGTAVVILDECHERHLDSDLALAFLVEVRAALRPDLRLLATSATAEAQRLAEILGDAPIVISAEAAAVPGRRALVAAHRARSPRRSACGWTRKLLDHVAATIRRALADGDGDVLAFLPGAREIDDGGRPARAARTPRSSPCTAGSPAPLRTPRCARPDAAGSCWPPRSPRAA